MTQTPVQIESSAQIFSTDGLSDFANDNTTSVKSVHFNRITLGKKLLLIILPTVLGSLACSSLLNYRNFKAQIEAKIKLQSENEVILIDKTATELLQEKLKLERVIQLIGKSFSQTEIALKSRRIQIISPQQSVALQTINQQTISQDSSIIGGKKIIAAAQLIQQQSNNLQAIEPLLKQKGIEGEIIVKPKQSLVAFSDRDYFYTLAPLDNTNLAIISSFELSELEKLDREMLLVLIRNYLLLGTAITILIIFAIHSSLTPLRKLIQSTEKINHNNLSLLVNSEKSLETISLAHKFNYLIFQIKQLLFQQEIQSEQAQIIKKLILNINQESDPQTIIETTIHQIYLVLKTERVVYCQVNNLKQGQIIAESINPNCNSILDNILKVEDYIPLNKISVVQSFEELKSSFLSKSQQQQLITWQVQAMIIAPVLINRQLEGFLMIHNCTAPRDWQPQEIDFVEQITYQMGLAFTRLQLLQQQEFIVEQDKQTQAKLQQKISNLIQEIENIRSGDLTWRASFTPDEIGKLAEAYNISIESLSQAIASLKTIVTYVVQNTLENQQLSQNLTTEIVLQVEKITKTQQQIESLKELNYSISNQAIQAEAIFKQTNLKITLGDTTINRTVAEINSIKETVDVASERIKLLENSSQEIAQAVNLITRFAAQTHLLALKASIEAARAGEQGRGFAVIADEVRTLATQSAGASAEIENLVAKIQQETQAVIEVMEKGTERVKTGADLVQQTRQNIEQVTHGTNEIQQLISAIALTSQRQIATSDSVIQSIDNLAINSTQTSQSASQLSTALSQLNQLSEQLQQSISKFKT